MALNRTCLIVEDSSPELPAHTRGITIGSFTRKLDLMLDRILSQEPFRPSIHIGVELSPMDPEHHQTHLKDVA